MLYYREIESKLEKVLRETPKLVPFFDEAYGE